MKIEIKNLKKGDGFIFNGIKYTVTKKYIDDDHPLKAIDEKFVEQVFHYDELEVDKTN